MHNSTVSLLAIAAATVLASDTPVAKNYWKKVDGEWKYMPEEVWTAKSQVQPTGTVVPQVTLPLQQTPRVSVVVVPRWARGLKEEDRKGFVGCRNQFVGCRNQKRGDEGREEEGEEGGDGGKEGGEEEEGNDEEEKRDVAREEDDDEKKEKRDKDDEDAEWDVEVKRLEVRKRKGVVCNVL